jgi:chromosome segregation ATPase
LQQKLAAINAIRSNIPSRHEDDSLSFEQAEAAVGSKRSDKEDVKQRVEYLQDMKKELSTKIAEKDRKIVEVRMPLLVHYSL